MNHFPNWALPLLALLSLRIVAPGQTPKPPAAKANPAPAAVGRTAAPPPATYLLPYLTFLRDDGMVDVYRVRRMNLAPVKVRSSAYTHQRRSTSLRRRLTC